MSGFAFVADVHRAVALASLLTVVLRGAFDNVPLFLITGHTPGEGKGFFADLVANLAIGDDCPLVPETNSREELEKRLGSIVLEGSALNCFDNLTFDLKSASLCTILTANRIKIRILGKSETPQCDWRGTFLATGNNITVQGDLVRRTVVCRLDSQTEQPEYRKFDFNPIEWITKDRGKYIADALIIARAYLMSGETVQRSPLGSFEGWSKFVREPLIWLGEPDPVLSQEAVREEDPEISAATELLSRLEQHFGNDRMTTAGIIARAKEQKPSGEERYPTFRAILVEHASNAKGEIDATSLGKYLKRIRGRYFDGRCVEVGGKSKRANKWILKVKV